MSVLFFLTALVASSIAQTLTCDFQMRHSSMSAGGFVNGNMKYSWTSTAGNMLFTFTTSGTKELYSWNANHGFTDSKGQYVYKWSTTCPCSIEGLSSGQPALFLPSTALAAGAGGAYTPTNAASLLTSVSFDSSNFPTKATFKDGRQFTFSGCSSTGPTTAEITPPSDCNCGKPIDVVLVLDRSSSINLAEFALEKQFTQNLVAGFTYSPLAVNLGITNFHTLTWDGPVTLAQGNNPDSVNAGANALQCASNPQCLVFGSSVPSGACCGSGTSVSSGIVNGADMLASASTTGVRAGAAKVLIVLTDGYHNKVLKRDAAGAIVRDAAGKPSGVPFTVSGTTCSEDRSQTACRTGLLNDLTAAVNYAKNKVPTVDILAVGVGDVWDREQLLAIAGGVESNVVATTDWNLLTSLVDQLVSLTCQQSPDNSACIGCCGFCSCSGCISPDGCDPGNFCDRTSIVGTCCTAVAKPPGDCDQPDKCNSYTCDRTANSGAGGCTSTPKPIKANTPCADYKCDPATGETIYTDLCPPECLVDGDCADTNACTNETCVISATDPHLNFCRVETRTDCTGTDKCYTYDCDPATGCTSTLKPVPPSTMCAGYACNPATGLVDYTNLCPRFPKCTTTTDAVCDDLDACTIDVCINPGDVDLADCTRTPRTDCTGTDLCKIYTCDPLTGCKVTDKPIPPSTNCSQYVCDPATGEVVFTDLCPPQPPCLVDTDCADGNLCTTDKCVLDAANPLNNKCEWEPIADTDCDDGRACTTDYCDVAIGCVHEDFPSNFCEDNDACTIDRCDNSAILNETVTSPCVHTPVVCDPVDICHETYCDAQRGCLVLDVICPTTDNCTVSGCNVTNDEGCYIKSAGVCGFPVGAVAGIAAGVVAGIVVAAVAGALIVGGGTAYAFTQGAGAGLGAVVANNPIYAAAGESGYSAIHKV